MNKINIRKTKKEDLKIISKIYRDEFSKPPYNENWTEKKSINKMRFFLKFYDLYSVIFKKQVIGFACINKNFMCPGEVAFWEEFAIKKEFQNGGIGTFVLNEIFKIYKKKGYKKFMGIVNLNSKASKLYKKLNILPSKKNILIEKNLR
ncbi:GNAT family N-acetyltransferase [Candidatus Pacearchaeota archaeon]|nr:GNAT family N-acetyltransferase [Candidatus Pacearchaeota archaeon]